MHLCICLSVCSYTQSQGCILDSRVLEKPWQQLPNPSLIDDVVVCCTVKQKETKLLLLVFKQVLLCVMQILLQTPSAPLCCPWGFYQNSHNSPKVQCADSCWKLIAALAVNKTQSQGGIIFSCKSKPVALFIILNKIIFEVRIFHRIF